MFHSRIEAAAEVVDVTGLLVEEANWLGAHFQHIVDRNVRERRKRIDAANQQAWRSNERRTGSRRFG